MGYMAAHMVEEKYEVFEQVMGRFDLLKQDGEGLKALELLEQQLGLNWQLVRERQLQSLNEATPRLP